MADYNNYHQQPMYNPPQYQPQVGMDPPPGYVQKSRSVAGILGILLGALGIHSFYLGDSSKGLMKLLISLLTCGVGAIVMEIIGILEGIQLLEGKVITDANGVYLKD